jgi:hypothetical protein
MPPRWLSLVIVGFWVTTTGWLLWHDLAPRFRTGEPPPYVIDLVEEVRTDARYRPSVSWKVFLDDREVFLAKTWVEPAEQGDAYELVAKLTPKYGHLDKAVTIGPLHVRWMETRSRVTREGNLLALRFETEARMERQVWFPDGPMDVVMYLTGEIRGNQLFPHLRIQSQLGDIQKDLQPVNLPPHGAVLVPLHPVKRIQGLRPNQTWHIPLLDPFANLLPGGAGGGALDARVLPEPQTLTHNQREVPCWVIQYEGESASARTWVRQDSGLVLRQEVVQGGERWRMERESIP